MFERPEIREKYGYTYDGDAPFYVGSVVNDEYAFTIFKSEFVIENIKANILPADRKYLMDGTFDCIPKEFYQLVIISIEYENDVSCTMNMKYHMNLFASKISLIVVHLYFLRYFPYFLA